MLTIDSSACILEVVGVVSEGEVVLIVELYFVGEGMGAYSLFFEFHFLYYLKLCDKVSDLT